MTASSLSIQLIGPLRVRRADEAVRLPQSKKARALLGYLAANPGRHRKDRLCELFWDVADDPRGGLRWCLSKLRAVVDEPDAQRICADRDSVELSLSGVDLDLDRVKGAIDAASNEDGSDSLLEAGDLFRGEFLEGLELSDFHAFSAWLIAEREECKKRQAAICSEIVLRFHDEPERALRYARDLVRLCPDSADSWLRLIEVLSRTDRIREALQQIETARRAWEQFGIDDEPLRSMKRELERRGPERAVVEPRVELHQEIRFCSSYDGASIAYATVGHGPPLVKAANWLSHLEYDWGSPVWRHIYEMLTRERTLIRYDDRGNGLSDWDVPGMSFEAFVADLEHVIDAAKLERFALLGISRGAAACIAYAAAHPDRVTHLIILGGFAKGWLVEPTETLLERDLAMQTLMRAGWGSDNPAFRQLFTSKFIPGGTLEQFQWFNDLQRMTASPENAVALRAASGTIDVRDRLSQIRAPTLVFHARGDAVAPYSQGRFVAAGIPNARFVSLDSSNHLLLEDEPAWTRFSEEVRRFLATPGWNPDESEP